MKWIVPLERRAGALINFIASRELWRSTQLARNTSRPEATCVCDNSLPIAKPPLARQLEARAPKCLYGPSSRENSHKPVRPSRAVALWYPKGHRSARTWRRVIPQTRSLSPIGAKQHTRCAVADRCTFWPVIEERPAAPLAAFCDLNHHEFVEIRDSDSSESRPAAWRSDSSWNRIASGDQATGERLQTMRGG